MSGAEHIVILKSGLLIGDVPQTEAVLREARARDIIEAQRESEQIVPVSNGVVLVPSPTMVGVHLLRRQVVRIGEVQGPLTLAELGRLSGPDMETLQTAAEALQDASLEVAERGRDDGAVAAPDAGVDGTQSPRSRLVP